jgi:hypothetical protein
MLCIYLNMKAFKVMNHLSRNKNTPEAVGVLSRSAAYTLFDRASTWMLVSHPRTRFSFHDCAIV